MTQRKTKKHAFTIVELVIVIAVIAILAAVLIPTFVNLIEKAKLSVDQQMVDCMNMVLQSDEILSGKPTSLNAAKAVLEKNNYRSDIAPTAKDHEFYWIPADNRVVLVKMNGEEPEKIEYPKYLAEKYATGLPTEWYKLSENSDKVICLHENQKYVAIADGNTSTSHMGICSDCSEVSIASEAHDTAGTGGACSKCGWKAPAEGHTHSYTTYLSDCNGHHYGVCSCGVLGSREDCTYVNDVCEKCHYSKPATGGEHTHQFTYTPTDPYNGTHTKTCSVAGCGISNVTEDCAYNLNKKCIYCGADMPGQGGVHTHSWSDTWTYNATNHWHECTDCHAHEDQAGHEWSSWTANGETGHSRTCSVCGYAANGEHDTLGADGSCSICGYTSDPCASGHVFADEETADNCVVVKEQTCTEKGLKLKKCTRCGSWIEVEIPEHHYIYVRTGNPYKVAHSAKCEFCNQYIENQACNTDEDGECSLCHGIKATCSASETDPAKHFFCVYVKNIIKEQPDGHSVKCLACAAYPLTVAHDTYGENGACSVCGYKAHDHVVADDGWTVTKAATCTAEGEKAGTCTVSGCGKTITQKIPATGHSISSFAEINVFNHKGHCGNCDSDATEAHKFVLSTTVDGNDRYVCACGAMIDIPTGTALADITGRGCDIHANEWGQTTTEIDGKTYTVYKATCNAGTAKGKEFTYYILK